METHVMAGLTQTTLTCTHRRKLDLLHQKGSHYSVDARISPATLTRVGAWGGGVIS